MKIFALTVLLTSGLFSAAFAGEHKLSPKDPVATITVPDKWKAEETDEGLDINSDDDEIYINIELNDAQSLEGAIEESLGYLKKNKVVLDKSSEKKQEATFNGMSIVDYEWKGTDADGACNISLTILGVTKDKLLLMLYWASPDGEKAHLKDLQAIQQSIKPIAK
jgi:hypothetical protein